MLSYFRLNDPYRLLGLFLILLILYIPFLTGSLPASYPELKSIILGEKLRSGAAPYAEIIDDTAPLTVYLHGFAHFLFGDSLVGRHLLASLLIFIQSVLIGIIFIDKKIYPESSFVPSIIYGMLFCLSFDNFALSGELIAIFFLLLALNSLYKELEFREESLEMVLRMGVYIGIASLLSFSFSIYLVCCFVILFLYSRSSGRKFALLLAGYLIPHLLMISIHSMNGHASELWTYFYVPNLSFATFRYISIGAWLNLIYLPVAFLVIAMIFLNRESRFTKYQSQVLQAMFFWTVFSFIQVIFTKEFRPQSLIPLIIPFTFFIAHFLLLLRRRLIAELAFWLIVAGSLTVGLIERHNTAESEVYARFIADEKNEAIKGKKILCLSDDLACYHGNQMSTPFVNWSLSKEIFEHPEYYENVLLVYEAFRRDPPDVVVDPHNLLKPFLEKIPEIKKQYAADASGYRMRSNK